MSEITPTLSAGAARLKRSVMRELLSVAVDPEIISLAGGLPASDQLPVAAFRRCLNTVLDRDGPRAIQYSPMHRPLREWVAGYMSQKGVQCTPDQIFITNGSQQGLTIISRMLLDPGDPAVIEAVTFTGIQQVTVGRGAEVRTVPTDLETGVDTEALEQAFSLDPRPRLAILIPDFHNPLGVSISAEKKARVAQLAARHGVPVIEDDPYSSLRFAGEASPAIKAFDEAGLVYYLGSFSKILAPAVRMGWIVAPVELMPQITVLRESLDLETSTLLQRAVAEFVCSPDFERYIQALSQIYGERSQAMLESLEANMQGLGQWTRPQGGQFIWMTMPEGLDTFELFKKALEKKVAFIPGGAFAVEGGYRNTMRLSFSNVLPEQIREGVGRLADVVRSSLPEDVRAA